ncbi:MAG: PQQ-binding-like beta-propeller repeat protein [Planctomycetaceae bacterium]|jgi:hypothetical protein|nr:PQQ-binding-like beta-propeller repeat protein [Planctomycetaceae bacterium]
MKRIIPFFCFIFVGLFASFAAAKEKVPLLTQQELARYGFQRVWFHQLKILHAEGSVQHVLVEGGNMFIVTSDAKLHVLDSETGEWLWSRAIGKNRIVGSSRDTLTEPAVNSRMVFVHNNVEIYIFHRQTGKQLLRVPLPSPAAAACQASEHYVYVPLVDQKIVAFPVKEVPLRVPVDHPSAETSLPGRHTLLAERDPKLKELKEVMRQFDNAKQLLYEKEEIAADSNDIGLDDTHRIPITCMAFGQLWTKPLLTYQEYRYKKDEYGQPEPDVNADTHKEMLTWVTEHGYIHTAKIENLSNKDMILCYRVDSAGRSFFMDPQHSIEIKRPGFNSILAMPTNSQIVVQRNGTVLNTVVPDIIVTGGRASYIFAIEGLTGNVLWQCPAHGPLLEQIGIIGKNVYAPIANGGGMHALDLETGTEKWFVPDVKRFAAASKKYVYVIDKHGKLTALDKEKGHKVFTYDIRQFDRCLFNIETDQIFLIMENGLIQCVREKQKRTGDQSGETDRSLRHRYSCAEFSAEMRDNPLPKLWWLEDSGK